MDYKLVLDVMVSALLLVTIIYAWVLNLHGDSPPID